MGEKLKDNTLALYGDQSTNMAYRNNSEQWSIKDDLNRQVVERSGFVPLRNRVLALLQSGERLLQARKDAFQYAEDEEPEDFDVDPTLQQDFTELDALQSQNEIVERIKEKKKNVRRNSKSVGDSVSNISAGKNEMKEAEKKETDKKAEED